MQYFLSRYRGIVSEYTMLLRWYWTGTLLFIWSKWIGRQNQYPTSTQSWTHPWRTMTHNDNVITNHRSRSMYTIREWETPTKSDSHKGNKQTEGLLLNYRRVVLLFLLSTRHSEKYKLYLRKITFKSSRLCGTHSWFRWGTPKKTHWLVTNCL